MNKSKIKNKTSSETKNIAKNYGKQIIKFVNKNEYMIKRIISEMHPNSKIWIY